MFTAYKTSKASPRVCVVVALRHPLCVSLPDPTVRAHASLHIPDNIWDSWLTPGWAAVHQKLSVAAIALLGCRGSAFAPSVICHRYVSRDATGQRGFPDSLSLSGGFFMIFLNVLFHSWMSKWKSQQVQGGPKSVLRSGFPSLLNLLDYPD